MEYLYYKSKKGNFGDDLNAYLWPKLFRDFPSRDDVYFIGIGSLLHNDSHVIKNLDKEKTKVIFGTGIKPSKVYANLSLDDSWKVLFFRGPLSASVFGNKFEYISDAAYALRQVPEFEKLKQLPKKHKVSLMPYFHSVEFFNWEKICEKLGYNYISPLSEKGVEYTLQEIASSEMLISEAMHGAILADVLRVPWHRYILSTPYTEGGRISEFKWNDWLSSIDISYPETTFIPFYERGLVNKVVKRLTNNYLSVEHLPKKKIMDQVIVKLDSIENYHLSESGKIQLIDNKIKEKITEFKNLYFSDI